MVIHQVPDIRLFYNSDKRFLQQFPHFYDEGLTSMFDCVKLNLAEIKTGNKIYIKESGEELGRVSDIIKKRDSFDFTMFGNLLKAHQLSAEDDAKLKENETVEYTQEDDVEVEDE